MEEERIEIISENFKGGTPPIEVAKQMNKAGYFIRRNPKNLLAFQLCRIKKMKNKPITITKKETKSITITKQEACYILRDEKGHYISVILSRKGKQISIYRYGFFNKGFDFINSDKETAKAIIRLLEEAIKLTE